VFALINASAIFALVATFLFTERNALSAVDVNQVPLHEHFLRGGGGAWNHRQLSAKKAILARTKKIKGKARVPSFLLQDGAHPSKVPQRKDAQEPHQEQKFPQNFEEAVDVFNDQFTKNASMSGSRTIYQTWHQKELPKTLENKWQAFLVAHPTYERQVFDDHDADAFMKKHFQVEMPHVYQAYTSIRPEFGAMRADLWRMAILYLHGGIYVDVDSSLNKNLKLEEWVNQTALLSQEENSWSEKASFCADMWSRIQPTTNDKNEDSSAARQQQQEPPLSFPKELLSSPSTGILLQWAMFFPVPKHPILYQALQLSATLVNSWTDDHHHPNSHGAVDYNAMTWSPMQKAMCLTGPLVFSVAADHTWHYAAKKLSLTNEEWTTKSNTATTSSKSSSITNAMIQKKWEQMFRLEMLPGRDMNGWATWKVKEAWSNKGKETLYQDQKRYTDLDTNLPLKRQS